ncbi:hypothetical protein KSP40_PGU002123 [Platanthera guangdongensis]|uniref:Glyceraldehyde 3-phosphate dehydrogenase NAD(P) binding domain-containing protein n=1 Tax=Platanthera guangdongensis TaxID=2320717 RepID=A0ABR2LET7_9ASPA
MGWSVWVATLSQHPPALPKLWPSSFPPFKGKLNGIALRVPTPNVSVVDLVVQVSKKTFAKEANAAFRDSAEKELNGILSVCDEPLVSVDFRCSDVSSTVDASLTMVMGDDLVKPFGINDTGGVKQAAHLLKYDSTLGIFDADVKPVGDNAIFVDGKIIQVLITAPGKGDIRTYVVCVNADAYSHGEPIISNASGTTNCLAPFVMVLDQKFGMP